MTHQSQALAFVEALEAWEDYDDAAVGDGLDATLDAVQSACRNAGYPGAPGPRHILRDLKTLLQSADPYAAGREREEALMRGGKP